MAEKHRISIPDRGLVSYTEGQTSVLEVKGYSTAISQSAEGPRLSGQKPTELTSEYDWAPWGIDSDNYPREVLAKNEKTGVILRGVEINSDIHFGNGLMFYRQTFAEGKKRMEGYMPDWFEKLNRNLYLDELQSEVIESLSTMGIAFIEVITDPYGKEVTKGQVLDFCHTRKKWKNDKGIVTHVYHSPDIGTDDLDKTKATQIPVFNPEWTENQVPTKFVIILEYRTFGRNYYPEPNYTASYRNGWADVAWEVPNLIKSIYKNQMSVKYHVTVDIGMFKTKYIAWDTPPDCETDQEIMDWQLGKISEFRDEINTHLTASENAGKAFVTLRDEMQKIGVTIEPIKSFLDSAKELPNAAAANAEMLFVNGVDPSLVGSTIPGGSNLSGSGSDKREASKLKQALMKRSRIISLKWLYLIGTKIYGMQPNEYVTYVDIDISQTLDENPTGKKQVSS